MPCLARILHVHVVKDILQCELHSRKKLKKIGLVSGCSYLIAAAHQRSAGDVQESHILGYLFPLVKLGRLDIPVDFHVTLRRAHVLPKGYDIDVCFAQVFQTVNVGSCSVSMV